MSVRRSSSIDRQVSMTLFSGPICLESHRVRMTLAEKSLNFDTVIVAEGEACSDLEHVNPYHSVPTLVERDVALYDPRIIMEYLDERFPYPSLMPADPITRARLRLSMHYIENNWFVHLKGTTLSNKKLATKAVRELKDVVIGSVDIFKAKPYFMYDEFTLLDCCVASVLWRIQGLKAINLKDYMPITQYMRRIFSRPTFRRSLTEDEAELGLAY